MRNKLILSALLLLGFSTGVWAQTPSGKIEKMWVDHDIYQNGEKGMTIHIKFSVDNMKGRQGNCNAWFYFKDGTKLNDTNSRYRTKSGHVATYSSYTPTYVNAIYNDFKLFMPYSELHMAPGEHDLKFHAAIIDSSGNELDESDWYHFNYKSGSAPSTPSAPPKPAAPAGTSGSKTGSTTIDNKDGSKTIIVNVDCALCFGTGSKSCMFCFGTGQQMQYTTYPYYQVYYINCPGCNATGKTICSFCFGAGYKTSSSTYYPNATAPSSPAQPIGGGYVAPLDGGVGGGSVGGSVGSSSTTCKGCRGAGSCTMCYGAKYRTCTACSGSGIGSSGSCAGCNGAGRNICGGCRGSGNCGVCYGSGTIRY